MMTLEKTKAIDELFIEYGVEEIQTQQALVRHELTKDPEFLGLMAKNTKELADQIKLITEDKET